MQINSINSTKVAELHMSWKHILPNLGKTNPEQRCDTLSPWEEHLTKFVDCLAKLRRMVLFRQGEDRAEPVWNTIKEWGSPAFSIEALKDSMLRFANRNTFSNSETLTRLYTASSVYTESTLVKFSANLSQAQQEHMMSINKVHGLLKDSLSGMNAVASVTKQADGATSSSSSTPPKAWAQWGASWSSSILVRLYSQPKPTGRHVVLWQKNLFSYGAGRRVFFWLLQQRMPGILENAIIYIYILCWFLENLTTMFSWLRSSVVSVPISIGNW